MRESSEKEQKKKEQKKKCHSLRVCNIAGGFMAGENERVEFVHEETAERQVIMPRQEGNACFHPARSDDCTMVQ